MATSKRCWKELTRAKAEVVSLRDQLEGILSEALVR